MKPDPPAIQGTDPRIHHTTTDTRERMYDRCRRTGIPSEIAKKIADDGTRAAHDHLDRRG